MSKRKKPERKSGSSGPRTDAATTGRALAGRAESTASPEFEVSETGVSTPGRIGFVFVMTNAAQPGLVKLGKTDRHPSERVKDEDLTTSAIPTPFIVRYYALVDDMDQVEKDAHEQLSEHGLGKDFFRVSPSRAALVIEQVSLGTRFREIDFATSDEEDKFNAAIAGDGKGASTAKTVPDRHLETVTTPTEPTAEATDKASVPAAVAGNAIAPSTRITPPHAAPQATANQTPPLPTIDTTDEAKRLTEERQRERLESERVQREEHAQLALERQQAEQKAVQQQAEAARSEGARAPDQIVDSLLSDDESTTHEFRPVKSRVARSLATPTTPPVSPQPRELTPDEFLAQGDPVTQDQIAVDVVDAIGSRRETADRSQLFEEFKAVENDILGTIDNANSTLDRSDSAAHSGRSESATNDVAPTGRFSNTERSVETRESVRSNTFFRSANRHDANGPDAAPVTEVLSREPRHEPAAPPASPAGDSVPGTIEPRLREPVLTPTPPSEQNQQSMVTQRRTPTLGWETPQVASQPGAARAAAIPAPAADHPPAHVEREIVPPQGAPHVAVTAPHDALANAAPNVTAPQPQPQPQPQQSTPQPALTAPLIAPAVGAGMAAPSAPNAFANANQAGADVNKQDIESWVLRRDAVQLLSRIKRLTWLWALIGTVVGGIAGFGTMLLLDKARFDTLLPWEQFQLDGQWRVIVWTCGWALIACLLGWYLARYHFRERLHAAHLILRRGRVD